MASPQICDHSNVHYCSPEVLVTFTNNLGEVLKALHGVRLSGHNLLSNGIQVAQVCP